MHSVAALRGVSSHDDSHMTISLTQKQLWPVQEFKPLAVAIVCMSEQSDRTLAAKALWARETIEGVIQRLEEQA